MENASKALIIAGAILLSILIIALGIFVFNAAKGAVNTDQLDATEIQAFNEPITQYDGRQMGTQVKSLLGTLISNAGNNAESAERLPDIVYVKGEGPVIEGNLANIVSNVANTRINDMSKLKSKIANSHYYDVEIEYDDSTGLVSKITINY